MGVACRRCGSDRTKRNGWLRGVQRHRCHGCGGYFVERAPRFGPEVRAQALDMHLNNVGVRKIARFVG